MHGTSPAALLSGLLCVASLCPPVSAGWREIAAPVPGDPLGVRIFRLDNGLEVYISENHDTPRFYAEIAVRTGSKYDPDRTTGMAHYMEHLLFKGSERLGTADYAAEKPLLDEIEAVYEERFNETDPARRDALYRRISELSQQAARLAVPNELDRLYRALGGRALNAHTWHEEVVYKIDLPSNMLRQWAAIESDRFMRPVFRLFQTELETVYEEMNRALDNKDRVIQLAVDALLYKKHPYGQKPTLGTLDDLRNPSLRTLNAFYRDWYVPNNMAVFLSGDVKAGEALAVIDEFFSPWEARDLPERPTWDDPPPAAREEVRVPFRGEPFVLLAFRTAPRSHADAEALLMFDMLLDNATAGLININLNQRQAVRQAGAFPLPTNDGGAQYLYGVPKPGQTLEEVEGLLLDQVDLIKRGEFDDWLVEAVVNDFKRKRKTDLENDEDRVQTMRSAWIGLEPWERAAGMIARLEKVTRDDVVRVANQYFSGGYVAGFREDADRDPVRVEKPPLPPLEIDATRQSAFAAEVMALPARPIEPRFLRAGRDYTRKEDPRGVTFYHVANPLNDVFTLAVSVERGTVEDPMIGLAARLLDRSGAGDLEAGELRQRWYRLGTTFDVDAGEHETTLFLSGLDAHFAESLALLMDLVWKPAVDDAAFEQLKAIVLQQREDARKDMRTMAEALVQYHRYGDQSPYLRIPPSDAVKAMAAAELQDVIRKLFSSRQAVQYTGSLPLEEVMDIFRAAHPVRGLLDDVPPTVTLPVSRPEGSQVWFLHRDATAQAHVQLEFGSFPYDPALSPQVQLYNTYFADGMAGIVFQELREARGLAYVAGARYTPGRTRRDQNLMMGFIQTQADKAADALGAFTDLLDNMPLQENRFASARETIITGYRTGKIGFRQVIQTVRDWERRGLDPDPREGWFAEIQEKGTLDGVSAFQQEHIAGKPKLISVVGDRTVVPLEDLKRFGDFRELTLDDVFVK